MTKVCVDVLQFRLVDDTPSLTNDGCPKRWVVIRPDGRRYFFARGRRPTTGIVVVAVAEHAPRRWQAARDSGVRRAQGRILRRRSTFTTKENRVIEQGLKRCNMARAERTALARSMWTWSSSELCSRMRASHWPGLYVVVILGILVRGRSTGLARCLRQRRTIWVARRSRPDPESSTSHCVAAFKTLRSGKRGLTAPNPQTGTDMSRTFPSLLTAVGIRRSHCCLVRRSCLPSPEIAYDQRHQPTSSSRRLRSTACRWHGAPRRTTRAASATSSAARGRSSPSSRRRRLTLWKACNQATRIVPRPRQGRRRQRFQAQQRCDGHGTREIAAPTKPVVGALEVARRTPRSTGRPPTMVRSFGTTIYIDGEPVST